MRVARRSGHRARLRGFSLLEALVAFVLFLTSAAMLTWAVTAAFSTQTTFQARAQVTDVVTAQLDSLVAQPLSAIVEGTFTVPSPCPGTASGIAGTSCVPVGASVVHVAYRLPDPAAADVAVCPGTSADPAAVLATTGRLLVQACATGVSSSAFADRDVTGVPAGVPAQTRTLVPDSPSQPEPAGSTAASVRQVVVHLSGDVDAVAGRALTLETGSPAQPTAQAPVTASRATIALGPADCTATAPCYLSADAFGEGGLTVTDSAGTAGIVAPATGGSVHVYATVTR